MADAVCPLSELPNVPSGYCVQRAAKIALSGGAVLNGEAKGAS